jgi:DNA anti-recombination protein RmuC
MKQAKIQWLKNPNQSNEDNMNNIRHEASRHFRNKKKEYLKAIMNFKQTVRTRISETCIGVSMTLRGGASLELM